MERVLWQIWRVESFYGVQLSEWRFGIDPKQRIGLFMGLLSVLMRDGITGLQMVEHMMQLFVLAACFIQMRQEKRQREARKAARRARVRQMQLQKREKAPGICA